MQLILDSETTIDIKRKMSTLNDSPLAEKLDAAHDLKSGLTNGNKENIQNNDNTMSPDEKVLENDKIEGDNMTESPMSDDVKEKAANIDVNDNDGENISVKDTLLVENIFEENSQKSSEENSSVMEVARNVDKSDPLKEEVTSLNIIEEVKMSDTFEGIEKAITEEISSGNDNAPSNGQECQSTNEEKDYKTTEAEENVEEEEGRKELIEVNGEVEVSEKAENAEKVTEMLEKIIETEVKLDNKIDICKIKLQDDKFVDEVNGKVHDDLEITTDEKCEKLEEVNKDSVKLTSNNNVTLEVKEETMNANIEGDAVRKTDGEALVAKPNEHTEKKSFCDPQMPNKQIIENLQSQNVRKDELNVHSNTGDIETVNLDDEEKETESTEVPSDIVTLNDKLSRTNDGSVSVVEKNEKSVTEMETVDLDDEKDSETEPMDVDINYETGEAKEIPVSEPSEKENTLTIDCEGNHEGNLSTKEKTENIELKNSITAMDEDSHPIESRSSDKSVEETSKEKASIQQSKITNESKNLPSVLKLSNTLDILSDDEDDVKEYQNTTASQTQSNTVQNDADKKCVSLDDDDDIMLIDEDDTNVKEKSSKPEVAEGDLRVKSETSEVEVKSSQRVSEEAEKVTEKEKGEEENIKASPVDEKEKIKEEEKITEVKSALPKSLVPRDFLKTCKKNMAEMTRDDLEEFCILKIVESVVDRSSLSEIKTKLKSMSQSIEEYKKKAMMLSKQNRDLQVVLKTIQEEQKNSKTVTPLKITRSVGMQVLMTERSNVKRKAPGPASNTTNNTTPVKSPRNTITNLRTEVKLPPAPTPQQIPVPRLIPASNSPAAKNNIQQVATNNTGKAASPVNGRINQQKAEKRTLSRNHSVTVDLTDDEPPVKVNRNSAATPVRVVPTHMVPQNVLNSTPRHSIGQNNPRKVYIPISGPQNPNAKPGQITLKSVSPNQNIRPRVPQTQMSRLPQNQIRMSRIHNRHPAPLPEINKIYPGNYLKALPPAPDLKLSKVENGIVISWKIEGYQEDSYEEIASYQLYAYQETNAPPNTSLWKKIGDVKALPLPMACTLTQFMAGFKYYFAVRAVDIRSRIGPFSLPGSILLLNKL
ncbi:activating transcription factor 7-interacting protein 2 [Plodia interpunctella]|uniref:activating transcription factor 7-interacting protein 2 n=1 Tax=Plodia interpunctella TaxID=58824 RepID=UPI0023683B9B|nr:activating transcription factor 7-interacting protein 2 [Plodia interpunctella]XP_053606133.1 activating transcription factor 7-interacting protein 2 [Plodia interpunctella]